jgi:thiamine transport system permease protein
MRYDPIPKLGVGVATLVATFIALALGTLLVYAPSFNITLLWQDSYYRHVTFFSFYQASLSTLLSVGLAIPVAIGLHRRRFLGRTLLIKLLGMTLVLPVLVGVFGLVAIYGNSGLIAAAFSWFSHALPFSLYGLNGILLAHLFFNLPYACRLFLHALEAIPQEQNKLAAHLGMSLWQKFRCVEWPRLRQQIPHTAGLVFMLCFTSFTTVMALGGGPKSTTIELAIYQAIKFDFDLQAGALLALWQILLCSLLWLVVMRSSNSLPVGNGLQEASYRLYRDSRFAYWMDCLAVFLLVLLVCPPLLMVLYGGLNSQLTVVLSDSKFWSALLTSLQVASVASGVALFAGIAILSTSRALRMINCHRRADGIELIGTLILVTPSLVISTGLFLLLRLFTDAFTYAYGVIVAVNAMMALPYVIKTLAQPMLHLSQRYELLCLSLGIRGWPRFRMVEWRALSKPLAHALSVSFLISMGDLTAIALFGSQDFRTLPLYLYQLLGSYQMDAAAVVALILLLFSLSCFYVAEKVFSVNRKFNKRRCRDVGG